MLILERLLQLIFGGDDEDIVIKQSFNAQTKSPQKFNSALWEENFNTEVWQEAWNREVFYETRQIAYLGSEEFLQYILQSGFDTEILSFAEPVSITILTMNEVSVGQKFTAFYLKSDFEISLEESRFGCNINALDEFDCVVDTRI